MITRRHLFSPIVAGIGFLLANLAGCNNADSAQAGKAPTPPRWLTLVTPHNKNIQQAFGRAFTDWYAKKTGNSVFLRWEYRTTPECLEYISQVAAGGDSSESRTSADVLFGGGLSDHQILIERHLSRPAKLDDAIARFPTEVAGLLTRDPQNRWLATGLSSFGIVFNARDAAARGVQPPTTWDDLADPRFSGWLGLADIAQSSSHRACMVVVLQKYGWNEGWGRITRMLANARGLVERSNAALEQTRNGIFLATVAVNFDGLDFQSESGGTLKYVTPVGATAVTPDAISILKTTREPELAEMFVRFVLSEAGQKLWSTQPDKSEDRKPLYHYALDPAVYQIPAEQRCVAENPLQIDFGVHYDLEKGRQYEAILVPLVQAACGENHLLLQQAWQALIAAGLPAGPLAELTRPPLEEPAAIELGQKYRNATAEEQRAMRHQWSEEFAARYRKVLAGLKQQS